MRVDYPHLLHYRDVVEGLAPVITLTLSILGTEEAVDIDAYVDSGTSTSLFDGRFFSALGGQLMNSQRKVFSSTSGHSIEAYLHRVRLTIPGLGSFDLDIGFSNGAISRNLLGRDFFAMVQIGFRESRSEYYLTPSP